MTSRANIVAESATLLSNVKGLENQRNNLRVQIEAAKERVEEQKRQAELISAIMKRNEVPSREETEKRLIELRQEIDGNRRRQADLKKQSQELQAQIDYSIAIRGKRTQYEKLLGDVRALAGTFDAEKQRENDLKLRQSALSSELLKSQLSKRQVEDKLAQNVDDPPDIQPIQKKRQGLMDQTKLVRKKREVFEQELCDVTDRLNELKKRQDGLITMADKLESVHPAQLQEQMIALAGENMDLRVYKQLTTVTESSLAEARNLVQVCDSLIERCHEVLPVN